MVLFGLEKKEEFNLQYYTHKYLHCKLIRDQLSALDFMSILISYNGNCIINFDNQKIIKCIYIVHIEIFCPLKENLKR